MDPGVIRPCLPSTEWATTYAQVTNPLIVPVEPDRIVIGSNSERALTIMKRVYEPFMAPIMVTDINKRRVDQTRRELLSCAEDLLHQCSVCHL
jgi:hypothetical protein